MEKCNVNTRYLICNEMTGLCAFLVNEKINSGDTSKLEEALNREDKSYLERIVNNQSGSAFRICKAHQAIVNAAKKVLESRQN